MCVPTAVMVASLTADGGGPPGIAAHGNCQRRAGLEPRGYGCLRMCVSTAVMVVCLPPTAAAGWP